MMHSMKSAVSTTLHAVKDGVKINCSLSADDTMRFFSEVATDLEPAALRYAAVRAVAGRPALCKELAAVSCRLRFVEGKHACKTERRSCILPAGLFEMGNGYICLDFKIRPEGVTIERMSKTMAYPGSTAERDSARSERRSHRDTIRSAHYDNGSREISRDIRYENGGSYPGRAA